MNHPGWISKEPAPKNITKTHPSNSGHGLGIVGKDQPHGQENETCSLDDLRNVVSILEIHLMLTVGPENATADATLL